MKMYSGRDVEYIVEKFLAKHFGFYSISLNTMSIIELEMICEDYGIEVENIVEQ